MCLCDRPSSRRTVTPSSAHSSSPSSDSDDPDDNYVAMMTSSLSFSAGEQVKHTHLPCFVPFFSQCSNYSCFLFPHLFFFIFYSYYIENIWLMFCYLGHCFPSFFEIYSNTWLWVPSISLSCLNIFFFLLDFITPLLNSLRYGLQSLRLMMHRASEGGVNSPVLRRARDDKQVEYLDLDLHTGQSTPSRQVNHLSLFHSVIPHES